MKFFLAFTLFFLCGLGTVFGQVSILQHNTPVTTNFNGWGGTMPTGYVRNGGGSYVGTSASTTGGVYAISNSGFCYQPSSNAAASSVSIVGTYTNNTGSLITSLKITYDAFNVVSRASRTPNWAVSSTAGNVSALTWSYNGSASSTSPDVKTVTLTGLNITNGATFSLTVVCVRGVGSGSSSMIGLNNIKVESIMLTPPTIFNSETFLTDFGDVMVGDVSSAVYSLTFDAEGLTNDVSVAAPAGFEVSTDNINWYPGVDISPVAGMLNDVEIYVRFRPTAVGPYSDHIELSSDDAATKTVLVTGNGIPALLLETTPASITSLGYPENGGPSAPFQLTGLETVGLDPAQGNITIAPALGAASSYEVSTDGTTWGTTALYPYTQADNSITNPTIYVRLKAGLPEGNIAQETINVTGGGLSTSFTVEGTIDEASSIAVTDAAFGPYCNGADIAFNVSFTPDGGFISPNYFAQLSNPDGSFPATPVNIIGTGTSSPIAAVIPAGILSGSGYRVRIYNDSPLTFSTNDNGHDIIINDTATFSGIAQAATICADSEATMNLSGLLPGSTATIEYNINGGATETVPGLIADLAGNASFNIVLADVNDGKTLTVTSIERTDVTPSCTEVPATGNTVALSVNPLPAVTAVTASVVCGVGENTAITLTGLLPGSTSDIDYTIDGGTPAVVTGVIADGSGEAGFTLPLAIENNGQQLEIVSITRTDALPNCTNPVSGVSTALEINERPTAMISGDQSICFGSVSSDITIGLTGTGPWNVAYTDGSATFNANNITVSPYVFTVTTFGTKTYTVTSVEDANCSANAAGMTGSATVTVNSFSNGGTISGSTTVCTGSNSGTLTLANNIGDVVKWQSSAAIDFNNPTDIANTTVTLDYTDLTETTYFRAIVTNGECPSVNSAIAAINVSTTPTLITQAQDFCNEGHVSDLFPTGTGIQWYADAVGGTALLPTDALSTGNYYATQTINGCESARTITAVTVNVVPAPETEAQEFCNTGTIAGLEPSGAGIKWYTDAVGGTALLLTEALSTGNYYAAQTINGCESVARTMTAVTVNAVPAPETEAQEFCNAGTVAGLEPSGAGIRWYADAVGGTALLSTEALSTGDYYVTQTIDGCESARTVASVTINIVPAPETEAREFCNAGTVAGLEPSGAGIKWYADAVGGTALLLTDALSTGNYYATQTVGNCESARAITAVTINIVPAPETEAQEFCNAGTVAGLEPSGAGIKWYADAVGGTALLPTDVLSTGNYYAAQTVGDCESARAITAVTVNAIQAPETEAQEFCNAGTVAGLEPSGAGIKWYADAVGGTALLPTDVLSTGNYYAAQTVGDCESARILTAVTINVIGLPEGESSQDFETGNTLEDLVVSGTGLNWYQNIADIEEGLILPLGTLLVNNSTYYVTQTVNECTGAPLAVTVTEVLGTPGFDEAHFKYYPNPVSDLLNISSTESIDTAIVFNMAGQQLISKKGNGSDLKLDVSGLAAGTYLVRVVTNGASKTFKVVKN